MNYLSAAKVLDELLLELIAKGLQAPAHTVEDLKTGRALASMGARDPGNAEIEAKVMPILEGVEMNLLALAEMAGGGDYADSWQRRIAEAYEEPAQAAGNRRMVHGAPKGAYWIRVQTSELGDLTPPEELELTLAAQEDGYTLVYGKQESVQLFLKDIREKLGKVGFKRNSN